jgi:hypothetical protein
MFYATCKRRRGKRFEFKNEAMLWSDSEVNGGLKMQRRRDMAQTLAAGRFVSAVRTLAAAAVVNHDVRERQNCGCHYKCGENVNKLRSHNINSPDRQDGQATVIYEIDPVCQLFREGRRILRLFEMSRKPDEHWIRTFAGMTATGVGPPAGCTFRHTGLLKNPGPPEKLRRVLLPGEAGSVTRRSRKWLRK